MYGIVRRKWACMRKECKTDKDICEIVGVFVFEL